MTSLQNSRVLHPECVCQTTEQTDHSVCLTERAENVCLLGSKVSNEPNSPVEYCLVTTLRGLLYDFIADKVIVYTARKRRLSQTRAHQQRLQRLAGGHVILQ